MKALVIEMTRSVERKLANGSVHSLQAGQRYTMDAATAAPYLRDEVRTIRDTTLSGGLKQVTLPPAAKIILERELPDPENADDAKEQAERSAVKAVTRAKAESQAYFAEASLEEATRADVAPVAVTADVAPVAVTADVAPVAVTADVSEDGG